MTSRDQTARELDPPFDAPAYRSTALRAPKLAPVRAAPGRLERLGVSFRGQTSGRDEADLTRAVGGVALGERIIVSGRVLDEDGRPVRRTRVEIWQANAAGRYAHDGDQHDAPLDPAFHGGGRCLTDDDGRYRFVTIKPGAYPWRNHANAWRPAHIHFSLYGNAFSQRLITQMYFPGDPLLALDPIFQAVPAQGQPLLISSFDLALTEPEHALGYCWDIVLRGPAETPMET